MLNQQLQGGTLSFLLFQTFFRFDLKCDEECKKDLENNFIIKQYQTNKTFYIQKKNVLMDKNAPILFFFCGLGVHDVKHRIQMFLNSSSCKCFNPVIFSLNLYAIHDLNKMIESAYQLFIHAKEEFPDFKFSFVGHSLGSGIATQTMRKIFETIPNPPIKSLVLISTYPNLSFAYQHSSLKSLIQYLFQNILDNESSLDYLCSMGFSDKIIILQGRNDKIFLPTIIENMVKSIKLKNKNCDIRVKYIEGDHFKPAEFEEWCKYACE
jgi:hypothetical protein